MGGATLLLFVAFGFAMVGELQIAGIALVGAVVYGAVEVVAWNGDPDSPPKFRDRYGIDNVRRR